MMAAKGWSTYVRNSLLAIGVASAGLWCATHGVAGVTWKDVALVVRGVTPTHIAWLTALWLVGLVVYATVLAGALPGLGARRGLLLNLTGSAVANVVPLGGAVATGLNWRMARLWGHSNAAFVSFCVMTNVLDVATKLGLFLVATAVLTVLSTHVPALVWVTAGGCVLALFVAAAAKAVLRCRLHDLMTRLRVLLVQRWRFLVPGSIGYVAAQVLLFYCCLSSVGLRPAVSVVLMAAAFERLGTLVPLSPGGAGVAELGAIAWLVATGLDPVEVVAGVILYRVFLFALEIPVGGVLLGGWAWRQRATARAAGEAAPA